MEQIVTDETNEESFSSLVHCASEDSLQYIPMRLPSDISLHDHNRSGDPSELLTTTLSKKRLLVGITAPIRRHRLLRLWKAALVGACGMFGVALLFAALEERHGGGHPDALYGILHGPALTIGRFVAYTFPECSLQSSPCWLLRNPFSRGLQSISKQRSTNRVTTTTFNTNRNLRWWKLNYIPSEAIISGSDEYSNAGAQQHTPQHTPKSKLVIAGQMIIDDVECNIAELDLTTNVWSNDERIQLSLYNSYSGGEVYSLLANRSYVGPEKFQSTFGDDSGGRIDGSAPSSSSSSSSSSTGSARTAPTTSTYKGTDTSALFEDDDIATLDYRYGRELIVVGAFDTTYRNSQMTYCSIGKWDGKMLNKVGEGLCNSALSKGMKITSAAFAGSNDVFVAGSFHTQVWNGDLREFVKIFNIAHFNATSQVWLPLQVGQLTCSWCVVTVLALAWDNKRKQLHVAGKFNAIDERNIPAGMALYDSNAGHLVAHPGGGLTLMNVTEDGVGTALQMDQENGVLYVMGSFERLSSTKEICRGLAAFEVEALRWTCLADPRHTVEPTGGGNMLLTPYGLMVAGKVQGDKTTWTNPDKPYTIALLTMNKLRRYGNVTGPEFEWSWLPGFEGHDNPIHCLSNGYGDYKGTVFIGGYDFVAQWHYKEVTVVENTTLKSDVGKSFLPSYTTSRPKSVTEKVPITEKLSFGLVKGTVMAISQLVPEDEDANSGEFDSTKDGSQTYNKPLLLGYTFLAYSLAFGALIGVTFAILCNKNFDLLGHFFNKNDAHHAGIKLDTLTYSAVENSSVAEAYERSMKKRFVDNPNLLTIINPAEIVVHRIIGEGTFGRVWNANWRSADVAVKEFVFAQAAIVGRSSMQREIIDEIIGEAGMMAMLRHPNVLQMFGCCLTSQAIWIVSELCSLGSLRQLLDDKDRELSTEIRLSLALQIADGMAYLHTQTPPIIHRDLKSHNIFVHETFGPDASLDRPKQSIEAKAKKTEEKDSFIDYLPYSSRKNGCDSPAKKGRYSGGTPRLVAKIGDWGSARAALAGTRTMTHGVGTACWLAPEVIKHARYTKASDVYGFAIILWELATRDEVYNGLEPMQIIAKVANENLRPQDVEDCVWSDLMIQCWKEDPSARPSFLNIAKELNTMLQSSLGLQRESSDECLPDSYQKNPSKPAGD